MLKSIKYLLSLVICLGFVSSIQAITYITRFYNTGQHTVKVRAVGGGNNTKLLTVTPGNYVDFLNPNASCLHKYELYNANANIANDNNGIPQEGKWDNWYLCNCCTDETIWIKETAQADGSFKFELDRDHSGWGI